VGHYWSDRWDYFFGFDLCFCKPMTLTFTPGTDFEDVCDGLEAVTLNRRGSSDDVSVTSALQRNVSTTEIAASDGKYQAGDVRWHLPIAEVATTPKLGDSIVDAAGDYWKILAVRLDTLGRRWRCMTRNLVIAHGLNDTVTIEEATYAKGTGGAMERTYHVWRSGVRARIQEVDTSMETDGGAKRTAKRYQIYLEDDYAVTHNHRIKDRQGNKYKIVGAGNKAELGQCQVVEATEWRSG
jgi:hypothetical protein